MALAQLDFTCALEFLTESPSRAFIKATPGKWFRATIYRYAVHQGAIALPSEHEQWKSFAIVASFASNE